MVIRHRRNAKPADSEFQRRGFCWRTSAGFRDRKASETRRSAEPQADDEAPAALLGTSAFHCRTDVHGSNHRLSFRPRPHSVSRPREMVACSSKYHRYLPCVGQSFHVVHKTLVRLRTDVQQVPHCVHGTGRTTNHDAASRILCPRQDTQGKI